MGTSNRCPSTKKALATLGVGPAAAEAYKDLLQPAARELGKNLHAVAKLITAALSPLHATVWGIDRIREWLSAAVLARLAHTAPEDIQPPKAYVARQALLQLTFCAEEEHLRDLYANLLVAAMNRRSASRVHPAFVQVIQQLSPDEALILQKLPASFELVETDSEYNPTLRHEFQALCAQAGVSDPGQADGYLDNLLRLRILGERSWSEASYRRARRDPPPSGRSMWLEGGPSVTNRDGRAVELTAFGEGFLDVCVRLKPGDAAPEPGDDAQTLG